MRRTFRLLASVKPARYLEPGTPTGLTGLYTHPSPRSTLLFLYSSTLDQLKTVPEHSVYRQSVEAVTKHRMAIVEAAVPPGYAEWAQRARRILEVEAEQAKAREVLQAELDKVEKEVENFETSGLSHEEKARVLRITAIREQLADLPKAPEDSNIVLAASPGGDAAVRVERDGQTFFIRHLPRTADQRDQEWDGVYEKDSQGIRTLKEIKVIRQQLESALRNELDGKSEITATSNETLGPEPQLTAEQISEIEAKIGGGLVEEVIQVAEGEYKLISTMVQSKVWESLEEPPAEGQWVAFERASS
ncbi:putative nadh-ubiquinone oxidoreductase [Podospora conica]|nr:putative nadh-ubiquinone oxidoreductase [Schizothecium conicum]